MWWHAKYRVRLRISRVQSPELSCAHTGYAVADLTAKDSKKKRGVTTAEVCGAPLDGFVGRVRARDDIIQRAVAFTLAMLQIGFAKAEIWSAAVGLWTHVLLFRRVAFGLFVDAYAFHPREGGVIRPSERAREDILLLVVFTPLFEIDIRAPVATTVTATNTFTWTFQCLSCGQGIVAGLGSRRGLRAI